MIIGIHSTHILNGEENSLKKMSYVNQALGTYL